MIKNISKLFIHFSAVPVLTHFAIAENLIDLDFKEKDLTCVLDHIVENSDIGLAYSSSALTDEENKPIKVTIRAKGLTPIEALEAITEASSCKLTEKKENMFIVKSTKDEMFTSIFGPMMQAALGEGAMEVEPTEGESIGFSFPSVFGLAEELG